ncbi:unnamed protein product [Camellia sinensis]
MEYIDNLPPVDLIRSEKMVFFQLIMPFESAQRTISYLGELGLLQFCDTSIVCLLEEGPGMLFKAIAVFAMRLRYIESCPLQKQALQTLDDNNNGFQMLFPYLFYVDFEASMADQKSQNALGHLKEDPWGSWKVFLGPRRHPNFVFDLIDKYVQKLELFVHCWK